MRTLTRNIYYDSRSTQFRLYCLTDIHLGAAACDENLLRRYVRQIAEDENALWLCGGDTIDAIARKGDKRYQESTLAPWLRGLDDTLGTQRDRLIDELSPIAAKCIGVVCGNHEDAALRFYDRNIYWEITTALAQKGGQEPQALALGVQGFIVLRFRRATGADAGRKYGGTRTLVLYTHHGYGGGRMPGGHALALGHVLGDYACDLALLGHRHVTQLVSKAVISPGKRTARIDHRFAMFCGTFLGAYIEPSGDGRAVDTYPEHAGLPPSLLGTPTILVKPDEKTVQVVLSNGFAGASGMDVALPYDAVAPAA